MGDRETFDALLNNYRGSKNAGDKLASLEEIIQEVGPMLFAYLRRACRDHQTTEDIYQETLIAIVKHIASCRSNLKSWSFQIAHSRLVDHFRKYPVEYLDPLDENKLQEVVNASIEVEPASVEERDEINYGLKLLERVPPRCRGLLWSRYVRDLDYKTIASMYNIKYDAVRLRISRCLSTARSVFQKAS